MASGRPAEIRRILVPTNGASAGDDSIRLACSLARKGKAKIYIVSVIKVGWTLPLDAESQAMVQQGEAVLRRAETVADEMDYEVETELLQAREIGPAIVDEAVERGVDAIVMGISYKRKFGEFTLGDTVPYVLKNAPCQVILLREATVRALEGPGR